MMISSRASMALALAVVIGATILIGGCGDRPRSFDQDLWQTGTHEQRGAMVRDLLGVSSNTSRRSMEYLRITRKSPLFGKNRTQVISLLGPPDATYESPTEIAYWIGYLGNEGYLQLEFSLFISFDEDGVTLQAHVSD